MGYGDPMCCGDVLGRDPIVSGGQLDCDYAMGCDDARCNSGRPGCAHVMACGDYLDCGDVIGCSDVMSNSDHAGCDIVGSGAQRR